MFEPGAKDAAEFVGLAGNQGQDRRVIRAIGGVGVHKDIWGKRSEHGVEGQRVAAVAGDEIPVQVEVPAFPRKP